jgi:hypothetical protein
LTNGYPREKSSKTIQTTWTFGDVASLLLKISCLSSFASKLAINETVSSLELWSWICSLLPLANQGAYIVRSSILFPDEESNAIVTEPDCESKKTIHNLF